MVGRGEESERSGWAAAHASTNALARAALSGARTFTIASARREICVMTAAASAWHAPSAAWPPLPERNCEACSA
jgi:hypothetical protein